MPASARVPVIDLAPWLSGDAAARVRTPPPAPVGRVAHEPADSSACPKEKLDAVTVG